MLMNVYWTSIDKHAAIGDITFEQFVHFAKHFKDNCYIQCLVQGNMTQKNVVEHVKKCVDILHCSPLLKNTMPEYRITKIPHGSRCCRVKNFHDGDVNSNVTNYYQLDTATIKLSVLVELMIVSRC